MPEPTPSFDRFFDLAPEIRDLILSHLVLFPEPIPLAPSPKPGTPSGIPLPRDLFLSHPLIYASASFLFYEKNTFTLDLASCPRWALKGPSAPKETTVVEYCNSGADSNGVLGPSSPSTPSSSSTATTTPSSPYNNGTKIKPGPIRASTNHIPLLRNEHARRRIRRLDFLPDRLGAAFEKAICPALADMALNGALRHLKVALYPTGKDRLLFRTMEAMRQGGDTNGGILPGGAGGTWNALDLGVVGPGPVMSATRGPPDAIQRQADQQYAGSEAFAALLRLLADPGLEAAELWVPPVHRALFCEFHGENVPCQFGGGGGRKGWRLVEVDWRRLAGRCLAGRDHEMHIVRVGG